MFKAAGIQDRRDGLILFAIIALLAITPLGREGTNPIVLASYRLLLLAISVGSILRLRGRPNEDVCPFFIGLCALTLMLMLVSIMWNPGSRFDGMYRWYQYFLFGAGFLAVAAFHRTRERTWKLAVLWSVVAIDWIYLSIDVIGGGRPLVFPFVNPNYLASFFLVGFSVSVSLTLFESATIVRVIGGVSSILLYYGMAQTWSRGATLAAIGVTALALFRFSLKHRISRAGLAATAMVFIIAGTAASPSLIRKFVDRGQTDPYNYQRPQIWLSALRVIAQHPVTGVGLGQFFHVSKRFSPAVEGTIARYMKRPGIAHSEYLQLAAEAGVPAAVVLFALAGYLVLQAVQRSRKSDETQTVFYEAAILTAAGLGAHALVDNNWSVPVMASGLMVFSTADVLPMRRWFFRPTWSARFRLLGAVAVLFLVANAVVIPSLAIFFNEAGHQALMSGNLERAESFHRLAAAIVPYHDVFLDNAGVVYGEMYAKSGDSRWRNIQKSLYEQALKVNPNSEDASRHMEAALIQELTGDPKKDQPIHQEIIEIEHQVLRIIPFYPFARLNLAEALYYSGRRDEAEQEVLRAIEYEPNYVPGYLRLSEWTAESGDVKASESYRRKALDIVARYENVETPEPYEALLLGRPLTPIASSNP